MPSKMGETGPLGESKLFESDLAGGATLLLATNLIATEWLAAGMRVG